MSELPLDGAPKEKHIIDKVADFLAYKGMKRTGAKGLAANWVKRYDESMVAAALRQAEVAPNVGNYAAYMAAIMKANTEPPEEPARQSQTIAPERAETSISRPKRPSSEALFRERDRLMRQWCDANADRLSQLSQDSLWYITGANGHLTRAAWIQAQLNLVDSTDGRPDITEDQWQDAIGRGQ